MSSSVVYLDHAATTPMCDEALAAMAEQMRLVGNASSLHASGRAARRVVEESREALAAAIGARPSEVVFTSGGTESDNLALKGIFWARRAADPRRVRILASSVEHHAVLDPLRWLAAEGGAEVELIAVDPTGRIDLAALTASIERDPETVALISVMWANNEVGTIQPVAEIAELAQRFAIPVHTDAVQAVGQIPVSFGESGVDALTFTAHKLGGPYGVGALVVRRELAVTAQLHGGGQERDIRSGTLDVPAIAGFAAAGRVAVARRAEYAARVSRLRDRLVAGILERVPDACLNGPGIDAAIDAGTDAGLRLPGNAHLTFPGCEGDSLLMLLDHRDIAVSTGSACSAGVPEASHVLLAMGRGDTDARSSLRFSLGHTSTEADVAAVLEAIEPVVERAKAAGFLSLGR